MKDDGHRCCDFDGARVSRSSGADTGSIDRWRWRDSCSSYNAREDRGRGVEVGAFIAGVGRFVEISTL